MKMTNWLVIANTKYKNYHFQTSLRSYSTTMIWH